MKSGSPQPLVVEVYAKRDRKGAFKDENRIACCSLPSSLTTGAAFARVKEFAERYAAAEVESQVIRSVKAFADMGARVGTRYKSVPMLKKLIPDYVRAFPQGVPVEAGGLSEGTIEVSAQGMDRLIVGIDGIVRIDLKAGLVFFEGVERLCARKDVERLYADREVLEGDDDMLEFALEPETIDAVRKKWFSGRQGHTVFAVGDNIYVPIE